MARPNIKSIKILIMLLFFVYVVFACDKLNYVSAEENVKCSSHAHFDLNVAAGAAHTETAYASYDTEEQRLIKNLFCNYSTDSRPVLNASSQVHVNVTMKVVRLDTVDEKGQSMRTKVNVRYDWHNPVLKWDPKDYNSVSEIIVKKSNIWTPPILLLNEASRINGEILESKHEDTVLLSSNGNCNLIFAQFFKSTCEINVSQFPFDEQNCTLDFGSWSMSTSLLMLHAMEREAKSHEYKKNGEWILFKATTDSTNRSSTPILKRNYSVIKITLQIQRKHFFFIMNLVVPCALIACMIFLVFVLPPKSGERISLGITVMLSMAIFQELSSEKLPSSSDNYPLLGFYYTTSMFEIGIALIMNCFILNLYYRNYEMRPWVRRLVLGKLAKLVFVPVPENRLQAYIESNNNEILREMGTICDTTINNGNHDSENGLTNGKADPFFPKKRISREETGPITRKRSTYLIKRSSTLRDIAEENLNQRNMSAQSTYPLMIEDSTQDKKQLGEDWRMVARVVDRIMLILSVSVGVISALTIFLQAKRFREIFVP